MNPDESGSKKTIVIGIFIFVIINLLVLDIWEVIKTKKTDNQLNSTQSVSVSPTIPQSNYPSPIANESCPKSCSNLIKDATSSLKLTAINTATTSAPTTKPAPTANAAESSVKEFFIPFGSGSATSDDWEDVGGLQANIDSTKYGKIKSAVFEASVRIPTNNEYAYVRLYNVTDKHPVWNSEVYFPGGSAATLLTSQSISLDAGAKLYKVQMKTQLKYQAFLDQSRLHITTY